MTGALCNAWIAELAPFDAWNERALMIVFGVFGLPRSLLDVGCGTGAMVNLARKLGVEAYGVDQIGPLHHEDWIKQHDLRAPLELGWFFQMVLSIETGEHIEPEHDQAFIDSVARHVDDGGLLIFTAAHPGQAGNGHVNCLVPGVVLSSPSALQGATRRWYCGETITVVTARGNELTVTPNHPILTPDGWVRASDIQQGTQVFSRRTVNGVTLGVVPNEKECPSKVEDIFASFEELPEAVPLTMPTTAKDFHGDGADGEVEIIWSDRGLPTIDFAYLVKQAREAVLYHRLRAPSLIRERSALLSEQAVFLTTTGLLRKPNLAPDFERALGILEDGAGMDIADDRPGPSDDPGDGAIRNAKTYGYFTRRFPRLIPINNGRIVQWQAPGLGPVTYMDPHANNPLPSSAVIGLCLNGQASKRFPGEIAFDEVVSVQTSDFVGHVYNVSTSEGWYWANDIVTHNCRPATYWRTKFSDQGLNWNQELGMKLALAWSQVPSPAFWLPANLQVFNR